MIIFLLEILFDESLFVALPVDIFAIANNYTCYNYILHEEQNHCVHGLFSRYVSGCFGL